MVINMHNLVTDSTLVLFVPENRCLHTEVLI